MYIIFCAALAFLNIFLLSATGAPSDAEIDDAERLLDYRARNGHVWYDHSTGSPLMRRNKKGELVPAAIDVDIRFSTQGIFNVAQILHGYLVDPSSQPKQLLRPEPVSCMLKDVYWGKLFKAHKSYLRSQGRTLKDCFGNDIYVPRMGYERPAVDLRGIVSVDTLIDAVEKVVNPVATPVTTRAVVAAISASAAFPVSLARSRPLLVLSSSSVADSPALAASSVHDTAPSDLMLRSYDDILRFRVDRNVLWLDPRTGAALHRKASHYVFMKAAKDDDVKSDLSNVPTISASCNSTTSLVATVVAHGLKAIFSNPQFNRLYSILESVRRKQGRLLFDKLNRPILLLHPVVSEQVVDMQDIVDISSLLGAIGSYYPPVSESST